MATVVGDALVRHRDVVQIAFTGSREVGTAILRQAAEIAPGQAMIKRVVCEMGGKNAIIVDDDADLDEAVTGVMTQRLRLRGPEMFRLLAADRGRRAFTRISSIASSSRLKPSSRRAPPVPDCLLPPVIDEASHDKLQEIIRRARRRCALPLSRRGRRSTGWFVPPAIFEVSDPRASAHAARNCSARS